MATASAQLHIDWTGGGTMPERKQDPQTIRTSEIGRVHGPWWASGRASGPGWTVVISAMSGQDQLHIRT